MNTLISHLECHFYGCCDVWNFDESIAACVADCKTMNELCHSAVQYRRFILDGMSLMSAVCVCARSAIVCVICIRHHQSAATRSDRPVTFVRKKNSTNQLPANDHRACVRVCYMCSCWSCSAARAAERRRHIQWTSARFLSISMGLQHWKTTRRNSRLIRIRCRDLFSCEMNCRTISAKWTTA